LTCRISALLVALVIIASFAAACTAPQAESTPQPPSTQPGVPADKGERRLFSPADLGLVESADREQWQRVEEILDNVRVADGSTVADIAAGGGWFTVHLARRVGSTGIVYAEEIQATMIQAISLRVQRENLRNVRPILGTPTDPRLPAGRLDAVFIINAFQDIDAPPPLLANIRKALNDRGLLAVVDFLPGGGGPGPDASERVAEETIVAAAQAANLRLVARYDLPPFEYLLVFGK